MESEAHHYTRATHATRFMSSMSSMSLTSCMPRVRVMCVADAELCSRLLVSGNTFWNVLPRLEKVAAEDGLHTRAPREPRVPRVP